MKQLDDKIMRTTDEESPFFYVDGDTVVSVDYSKLGDYATTDGFNPFREHPPFREKWIIFDPLF